MLASPTLVDIIFATLSCGHEGPHPPNLEELRFARKVFTSYSRKPLIDQRAKRLSGVD
jgi:hypothetical protein